MDLGNMAIGIATFSLLGNGLMFFVRRTLNKHDEQFREHAATFELHSERIRVSETSMATLAEQSKNNGERGERIETKLDNLITRMIET